jgi:hypothetical protein
LASLPQPALHGAAAGGLGVGPVAAGLVVVVTGVDAGLDGATGAAGGLEQATRAPTAATSSPTRRGDPDDLDTTASRRGSSTAT